MSITEADIERELAQHRAKVKASEERVRKETLELERARNALVERGCAFFDAQLKALVDKAISYARDAGGKLAKLPAAPVKPDVRMVDSQGFDAYVAAAGAYPAARDAHQQSVREACGELAPALRGLSHQADAIRRRCRELGFALYEGVGFLREDQRKPRLGTALIDFAHVHGQDLVSAVATAAERGDICAGHCTALVELLSEPAPQTQNHPERTLARIWERVRKADDSRAHEREMAERRARGEAVPGDGPSEAEQELDRITRAMGAGVYTSPIGRSRNR